MTLADAVAVLDDAIADPTQGLPDEVFYFISRTTPLINVDLLIKDDKGRTLLAWRADQFCGCGWPLPGRIIRLKETIEQRIQKVAEREIGRQVEYDPSPIKLTEMIHHERGDRSHFISLLFACRAPSSFEPKNQGLTKDDPGFLKWHDSCPDNLIDYHKIHYETFI